MPSWLRSALLAACVATACVEHMSSDALLDGPDASGAGGSSGATAAGASSRAGATDGGTAGSAGAAAHAGAGGSSGGGGSKAMGGSSGSDNGGADGAGAGAAGEIGVAGAGGEPSVLAIAKLEPTTGNSVTGEARFEQTGDVVKLSVSLTSCPAGAHALHLHINPDCSDDANASGGNWSPQGDGIDEVTCADDGTGKLEFSPAAGTWSIAGKPSSDLLRHSVVLHVGGKSEPAGRIACGLPLEQP